MPDLVVYKNRTNRVPVTIGFDISGDTFVSEIRAEKNSTSLLIATWDPTFLTDGIDGILVLTLDNSLVSNVTQKVGYMDIKRIHNGEPYPVFNDPIKVTFKEAITV